MALWHDGDNMTEKRRNRESAPLRLLHPTYDVSESGAVTAAMRAIDGDDVVTGETTHYTCGASSVGVLYSITLVNNDTVVNQASVHLVESGGSSTAANRIWSDTLLPGESVEIAGPWFLDPLDQLRSISVAASANEVALTGKVLEISSAIPGSAFIVDDGSALTTSKVAYYTCPASLVQHTNVVAITVCNTHTTSVVVAIEIRPSGGSVSANQNIFNGTVLAGETVILGTVDQPYLLEPGDAIYATAATGAVVGFRVTPVEYART